MRGEGGQSLSVAGYEENDPGASLRACADGLRLPRPDAFLHDLDAHCLEITLEEVKRWPSPRKWRNWILRILGGPLA